MVATFHNHVEIVKLLLEFMATKRIANEHGTTPVEIARLKNHSEIVKVFTGELILYFKIIILLYNACLQFNRQTSIQLNNIMVAQAGEKNRKRIEKKETIAYCICLQTPNYHDFWYQR